MIVEPPMRLLIPVVSTTVLATGLSHMSKEIIPEFFVPRR
jgi:hypothetical protein